MRVVSTYIKDGRLGYKELHDRLNLLHKAGWQRKVVYKISGKDYRSKRVNLKCYAYISPNLTQKSGKGAFWILSGVHGEEPAGPNALAENVALISKLAKSNVPVVLMPLLNPSGYIKDYRYYNSKRHKKGKPAHSVTDSEHLLPNLTTLTKFRQKKPSNKYARQVLDWVDTHISKYPPLVVFDHHEDEIDHTETENINSGYTYSYCYGNSKNTKKVAKLVTDLLVKKGFPIQRNGRTWFDEKITEGFVSNSKDGSIDEYLSLNYPA